MQRAAIFVALAVIWIAHPAVASPFVRCTAESYTTGGLSPGDGEGVWLPSDFQVAFDCTALAGGPPDPAPVYALFNTLFGFESKFPLPPGEFEIDADRPRPLFRFVPEDPESFGQWWQDPTTAPASPASAMLESSTTIGVAGLGVLLLGALTLRLLRTRKNRA